MEDVPRQIAHVKRIHFGFMSADEVEKYGVPISKSLTYENSAPVPGGLYDSRLGPVSQDSICRACSLPFHLCPGHFGSLELAMPFFNPLSFDFAINVLRAICFNAECNELLGEMAAPGDFSRMRKSTRSITRPCPKCGFMQPYIFRDKNQTYAIKYTLDGVTLPFSAEKAMLTFMAVTPENARKIFRDGDLTKLMLTSLPVLPTSCRPPSHADDIMREDSLSLMYSFIIKSNQELARRMAARPVDAPRTREESKIVAEIATYLGILIYQKMRTGSNRFEDLAAGPLFRSAIGVKGLRERVEGKDGGIRAHILGKRCIYMSRAVICGDPTLPIDCVGVPLHVAKTLSMEEQVTAFNIRRLQRLVTNGLEKYPGASAVRKNGNWLRTNCAMSGTSDGITLQIGDAVKRDLIDNDIVMFNRQPTLHAGSMNRHYVRVDPFDLTRATFTMNLSATASFNADFDGDEMTVIMPCSLASRVEIDALSGSRMLVSPESAGNFNSLFQDDRLAVHLLKGKKLPHELDSQLRISAGLEPRSADDAARVPLLESISPHTQLGTGHNSAFARVYKNESPSAAMALLNSYQKAANRYLAWRGFSIGMYDFTLPVVRAPEMATFKLDLESRYGETIRRLRRKAAEGRFIPEIGFDVAQSLERAVLALIGNTDSTLEKIRELDTPNSLQTLVESGAKGKSLNIVQTKASIAQILVSGRRPQNFLYKRAMPYFLRDDIGPRAHGYCFSSFSDGLGPSEQLFAAAGGREVSCCS